MQETMIERHQGEKIEHIPYAGDDDFDVHIVFQQ